MTGSISDLVRSFTKRTGRETAFVKNQGRALQNVEILPLAKKTKRVAARPRDLVNLLFGSIAPKIRLAPKFATRLASLQASSGKHAVTAAEELVAAIWSGKTDAQFSAIRIIETSQPIVVIDTAEGSEFFYPSELGQSVRCAIIDGAYRSTVLPGSVIASIGADLGCKGSANA